MEVHQYLGPSVELLDPAFKRSLPAYADALQLYKEGRFGAAMPVFRKVGRALPTTGPKIYCGPPLQRCEGAKPQPKPITHFIAYSTMENPLDPSIRSIRVPVPNDCPGAHAREGPSHLERRGASGGDRLPPDSDGRI